MIKYLLNLYVTLNGNCYPDKVLMWGNVHEIHVVATNLNIHADYVGQNGKTKYKYYVSNDTLYAVKKDYTHSVYIDIQATRIGDEKLYPLYGVILNSNPCK